LHAELFEFAMAEETFSFPAGLQALFLDIGLVEQRMNESRTLPA
jgi:hypothetical protein